MHEHVRTHTHTHLVLSPCSLPSSQAKSNLIGLTGQIQNQRKSEVDKDKKSPSVILVEQPHPRTPQWRHLHIWNWNWRNSGGVGRKLRPEKDFFFQQDAIQKCVLPYVLQIRPIFFTFTFKNNSIFPHLKKLFFIKVYQFQIFCNILSNYPSENYIISNFSVTSQTPCSPSTQDTLTQTKHLLNLIQPKRPVLNVCSGDY